MNIKFIKRSINALKLKYKSIQKSSSSFPLRIIDKELSPKNGDVIYTLQIVGKNIISKVCATELFNDKYLLDALSPYSLLKFLNITNKQLFYKKDNLLIFPCRVNYKILSQSYDHVAQQTVFTIEIIRENETIYKKYTALDIVNNPLLLEKLNPKETYELGFAVGSEAVLKEMLKLAHCTTHSS